MFYYLMPHPILITAAVVPAVLLLVYVYRKDKLEKEPRGLLFSLLLFGVLATFIAMGAETLGGHILDKFVDSYSQTTLYNIWMYFVIVAGAEEGSKYLLLRLKTWKSPHFNCQFDGVIYAVFIALGFAIWENINYVLMFGLNVALVRAVTAIPGHACFGVFMGAWYGAARRYANMGETGKSRLCRWLAFLLPALAHGAYDYIASLPQEGSAWIFVVFILAMFCAAFVLVRRLSRRDQYIDGTSSAEMTVDVNYKDAGQ